eukprot:4636764-Amphidinium_carterae.1
MIVGPCWSPYAGTCIGELSNLHTFERLQGATSPLVEISQKTRSRPTPKNLGEIVATLQRLDDFSFGHLGALRTLGP